jgi:hypothetical protein
VFSIQPQRVHGPSWLEAMELVENTRSLSEHTEY